MSSYAGGNGIYYGNFYPETYLNQPINIVSVTNSPIIIKCEADNTNGLGTANSSSIKCDGNNEKLKSLAVKKEDCIVSNSNNIPVIKNETSGEQILNQSDTNEGNAPELDIIVNNVVCSFNVRCHLNLRQIALSGAHVEYRRENGMVTMKLRKPYTTASIWSSGKITCTGATSNEDAKTASRKVARSLQRLGFRVRFTNYRVVNVLCTCFMYFGINLIKFAEKHRKLASYEPELHPGATYKVKELKATLKIFTTGSITITAPSISNVQLAVEHIFPLVYEFRTALPPRKNKGSLCSTVPASFGKRKNEVEFTESEEDVDNVHISSDSEDWD